MAAGIGVGSALRRARELRGITLDQASRDTKLRTDQLSAAEAEDFMDLGGEVYARAVLRTYAEYLGLDSGKVVKAYARHAEDPPPPRPPAPQGPIEKAMMATRIRDNQRFLLIVAVVVLAAMVGVGFVSRRGGPDVAAIGTSVPSAGDPAPVSVQVVIDALGVVRVQVDVDGEDQGVVRMREGETLAYSGTDRITVEAGNGGAVSLTVDGERLGVPGSPGEAWSGTYVATEPAP
jgi:hypothetical protein